MKREYIKLIKTVRQKKPLIHHITNYVTVNDCANITLAIGASPIMADDFLEVEEIVGIADALVLNMGTLHGRIIPSMIAAGRMANKRGIPVILDPVGAGASKLRNEIANRLLNEVKIDVLCGNVSEIRFLAGLKSETKGVDASEKDIKKDIDNKDIAKDLAKRFECVVAVTGAVDVISDGDKVICIENGHAMLSNITGTGCMCTSLIGSLCGVDKEPFLDATVTAILSMGIAGEIAFEKAGAIGNGSFRMAIHDAISQMNGKMIAERGRCYEANH